MSLEINANNPITQHTDTSVAVKTANLAKSQTELEGQMALDLIATAAITTPTLPTTGNSGQNINIKV
ncbi:hypothetical protein [Cognaticolwellia aestuarii]|uniref:hypothetical protein n=1 Tax=Cognaticolwellia aestuarii TaxID=329993 RepID=UPI000984D2A7|nr:hypothetical protein [Cognaticolwellia aestuarii]